MDSERWQQLKTILDGALETAPAARHRYLAEICGSDAELRREIEGLLEFEEPETNLLEKSAFSILTEDAPFKPAKSLIGKEIGKYRIISELGAGGMGAVYLAERADGAFEQRVALKLIRRAVVSDFILRRFVNERQILASLEHPNIAHLIDGGATEDDLPYLVMEYVCGENIIEFAKNRRLSLEERLDLFRKVCAAVSFAHRNLVIHRDLKPSNILVAKDGTPKLLDFGIAKLLKTGDAQETATQHFVFTPEYASPEQIRGENLTTATDIYSLGVILYELLTDSRPFKFDGKNLAEVMQTATKTAPVAPSAIHNSKAKALNPKSEIRNPRSLRGDLDNIVLKALKKEPERRYSSVEQFSEDIRRHLRGLPVAARSDTLRYRAEKFVRRNPLVVAALLIALTALGGGILAVGYQARIANAERAKAERRFNDVRQLANSFMFEINEQIMNSPVKARELLVQRAVEYLDKLAAEAGDDLELQNELATAYEKIGDVQSEIFKPITGKTSEALSSHQKALELRKKLFAAEPNSERAVNVASSYLRIGDILLMSGKIAETREAYRESIRFLEPILAADPKNGDLQNKLASSYARLGQAVLRSGSLTEALEHYEKSLALFRHLAAENPEVAKHQRSVGILYSYIGFVNLEMGKMEEGVNDYANWLEIEKKLNEKDKNSLQFRSHLSTAYIWYGVALSQHEKMREALAFFHQGIKIQEEIFALDTGNLGEEYALADCHLELGKALVRNKMADDSIKNLEKAIEIYRKIWQKDPENLMTRHRIANAQRFLADALFQKNNLEKALQNYEQSLATFKDLTDSDAENVDWQQDLGMNYVRLGELALKKNDQLEALKKFEPAFPIFEKLAAKSPENVKRRRELETVKTYLEKLKS